MSKILKMREARAALVTQAQKLTANDVMTAEESQQFDNMLDEIDRMELDIKNLERLEQLEITQDANIQEAAANQGVHADEMTEKVDAWNQAYDSYIRHGFDKLNPEQQAMLQHGDPRNAQSTGTNSEGGFLVAPEFMNTLESALDSHNGVRELATVIRTSTGANLQMPTENDTSQEGELLGENAQAAEQDLVFSNASLDAYKFSSKIVKVPFELLQDSAFSIDSLVPEKLGLRLARITNRLNTTGTGTGQPNGVITAATVGVTAASATAFTHDELLELEHSVIAPYRKGATFMFNDSVLLALRKLKDSEGRPLWQPSVQAGVGDTISGYQYAINDHMANIATGNKTISFGQHKKYYIRDVQGIFVLRLTERYADYGQVGFIAFMRQDSELLDAGTNPIKVLQQA